MNAGVDVEPALAQSIVRRLNHIMLCMHWRGCPLVVVVGLMLSLLMAARSDKSERQSWLRCPGLGHPWLRR